jgi:hypothetical protein
MVMATKVRNYLEETIIWRRSTDPEFPYKTEFGGDRLSIRLNDFPHDRLYTLIVNDRESENFDDWPEHWDRA